ncbi:vanadium-dependent haloperoxidase [Flavisolibacter nicotianae]|uniref:vanadium-dependent haloperoxidase n=1 Tax=Flavisolibacter nicotianae TaxID=2364882 RepID=UPI000EB52792|nr:vanadium-dependent haloperoxidase [Flavisolibacter nicotianae]
MNVSSRIAGIILFLSAGWLASCKKDLQSNGDVQQEAINAANQLHGHLKQTKTYSSEVPVKWLAMQLRINRVPPGTPGGDLGRMLPYCGIALYEAVVNGMPSYQTLSGQLNEMPSMPTTLPGVAYHWAASANAALAYLSKNFLPNATAANKASMDSLENALNQSFATQTSEAELKRSLEYGTEVARRIFEWSKSDGVLFPRPPYVPPVGVGLWAPTPPNFAPAVNPYAGLNRLMVVGSGDGAEQPRPPMYSTDPSSAYYAMVKEVYDVSQTLTPEQTAIGLFYRSNPGYPGAGQIVSVLHEILNQANVSLDLAAEAYAKGGIGSWDAIAACFKAKYTYNVERPITYIRNVLGHPTWNALFATPSHPEFPSAHSVNSTSFMTMLTTVLGDNFHFTDHTFDYLGMAPRSFTSLNAWAAEAAISRVYAGIHYRWSIEKGSVWGQKIAKNILAKVKFKKE